MKIENIPVSYDILDKAFHLCVKMDCESRNRDNPFPMNPKELKEHVQRMKRFYIETALNKKKYSRKEIEK